jgi:hypothetical protein
MFTKIGMNGDFGFFFWHKSTYIFILMRKEFYFFENGDISRKIRPKKFQKKFLRRLRRRQAGVKN